MRTRKLWAGLLLAASFASSSAFHNHADLVGAIQGELAGNAAERVVSTHSPLSHGEHWHSGVVVKDDPCLACQIHRAVGVTAEPCRDVPLSLALCHEAPAPASVASFGVESHGSRGPPALL